MPRRVRTRSRSNSRGKDWAPIEEVDTAEDSSNVSELAVTNEYVLNVAFVSFLLFTTLQFFFAALAHSQSMMADCAAMAVDVVTYLFNFVAERSKSGDDSMNYKQLRLYRLYLELIAPLISVTTLLVVTVLALNKAIHTIQKPDRLQETEPDLGIMLTFSGLNLLLDIVNVGCFARVDQALGLQHTIHPEALEGDDDEEITEATPLIFKLEPEVQMEMAADSGSRGMNLNMCSAWTHICADTMRSIAVLVAAAIATIDPHFLSAADADSYGAIVVSIIILVSLIPLFQGLYLIARKIATIWREQEQSHAFKTLDV